MSKLESAPLLQVQNLKKYFDIQDKGKLHAVDDISFDIKPNETLGLVGESGCGKSTVGNVLSKLLPETGGEILFEGRSLTRANKKEMESLRQKIQMIFQDPYSSLNPKKSVYSILAQPYKLYHMASGKALDHKVRELAEMVGLEEYVLEKFPHELDGGKRQLTGIARALALDPRFIVCDEPVSALDVSVQATIINLLIDMQKQHGYSYLFISHDLSVVRHISNRVAVMYLGQIVEIAETAEIFGNTLHPYSVALLSAVPKIEFGQKTQRIVLTGDVPSPMNPKPGCRFAARCWMARDNCRQDTPVLETAQPGHRVACHYWKEMLQNRQVATQTA